MSLPVIYRILETFCGAGGSAVGYHRAGFKVVGVDIKPQKNFPFAFILGNALDILRRMMAGEKFLASDGKWYGIEDFDAIHASPPCQRYTKMQQIRKNAQNHPDLVDQTRQVLKTIGKPYVIENVIGAPIRIDVLLCGTMFGLHIIRHRGFECSFSISPMTKTCNHSNIYDPWHGAKRTADKMREAMGIDWMPSRGGRNKSGSIDEAVPPAYTEHIGKQLIQYIDQLQQNALCSGLCGV